MPVKWVFDTWSNQKEINPPMIRQVEAWMYLRHMPSVTPRCFKYKHNTQNSIPSIAKLISTVSDSNVKKCRLCQKTSVIFVPVCCNHILSNYLVGLNNRKFLFRTWCWSSYEDEVLYQHYYEEKQTVWSSNGPTRLLCNINIY